MQRFRDPAICIIHLYIINPQLIYTNFSYPLPYHTTQQSSLAALHTTKYNSDHDVLQGQQRGDARPPINAQHQRRHRPHYEAMVRIISARTMSHYNPCKIKHFKTITHLHPQLPPLLNPQLQAQNTKLRPILKIISSLLIYIHKL